MKIVMCIVALFTAATSAYAAEPVVVNPNQAEALTSENPKLAANKKLVSEYWRTVFMARRVDQAERFVTPNYKEHAPTMPGTGRAAFMKYFEKWGEKPLPIPDKIKGFVAMTADRDLVILATIQNMKDANGQPYTTTWFDMFRVENGKIAEHWDNQRLPNSTVVLGFDNDGPVPIPK